MKNFFIKHRFYLLVMSTFMILFSILVSQVVLYADDFALQQKALTYDLKVVWEELHSVYLYWGGGPTPALAILTLMIGFTFWKIMNVAMITLSIHMITIMIVKDDKNKDLKQSLVAFFLWCFIFLISLSVARETLYWFDGSMAYVLTTFLTISYFYFCNRYIESKKNNKWYHYVFMVFLSFFAGWNGPQMGALSVFISFLLICWQKYIKKKKINSLIIVSACFTLLGFLILYFAPGNAGRMSTFPEYQSLSFIGKIVYRIDDITNFVVNHINYPNFQMPTFLSFFSIILVVLILSYASKHKIIKKKPIYIACTIISIYQGLSLLYLIDTKGTSRFVFLTNLFDYNIHLNDGILKFLFMIVNYITFGLYILSLVYLCFIYSKERRNSFLLITMLSAVASQIMMIMAPYSPYRSSYITIFFLISSIVYLVYELYDNKKLLYFSLVLCFYFYDFNFALFFTLIYWIFIDLKKEKEFIYIIVIMMIIPTVSVYMSNLQGYMKSKNTNDRNLSIIREYKNKNKKSIQFCKLEQEDYSFTPLYSDIEWIRHDVVEFFHIKKNTKITVIDCE